MKILLDTHICLWMAADPDRLTERERQALESPDNSVFVSAVSLWEISMKYSLGKLSLGRHKPQHVLEALRKMNVDLLDLRPEDAVVFHELPRTHKDPFDRMLIWQAVRGRYVLMTRDLDLAQYQQEGLKIFS